jgi:hypothetical protein
VPSSGGLTPAKEHSMACKEITLNENNFLEEQLQGILIY